MKTPRSLFIVTGLCGVLAALVFSSCAKAPEPAPPPPVEPVVAAPPVPPPPPVVSSAPVVPAPVSAPPPTVPEVAEVPLALGGPYHQVLALVIGNNSYAKMPKLLGAEADAEAVAAVLKKNYGFKVRSLVGAEATAKAIRDELAAMRAESTVETDVILYFAGHGVSKDLAPAVANEVTKRTGFAVPFSAEPLSGASDLDVLRREAIEMQVVVDDLMLWKARHRVVILDCCYSGLASKTGQTASLSNFDPVKVNAPSVQVITAGFDGQLSLENAQSKRGVFTLALVEALEKDSMQRIIPAFCQIRERVVSSPEFLSDPRSGEPQFRLLSADTGEFVLLPLKKQATWENILENSEMRNANFPADNGAGYAAATDSKEYENTIKPKENAASVSAVELTPEDLRRHEVRAALGDPVSLAVLSEYHGRSKDPASKAKAFTYARGGYETGSPYGTFALGRAYEKGYGVEPDPEFGKALQKRSGLANLLSLAIEYQQLNEDLKKAKDGDVASMVSVGVRGVSFLKRTTGFLGTIFAGNPDKQVAAGHATIVAALAKGDLPQASVKVATWMKNLEKVRAQTDRQELLLNELKGIVAGMLKPGATVSQQMLAYEDGVARAGPVAQSLAASLKGGSILLSDLQKVSEALQKGNTEDVGKAFVRLQKSTEKMLAATPREQELLAQIRTGITPLLLPITPPSAQLAAYEKGLAHLAPLAEAFVDELAGPAPGKPEAK